MISLAKIFSAPISSFRAASVDCNFLSFKKFLIIAYRGFAIDGPHIVYTRTRVVFLTKNVF